MLAFSAIAVAICDFVRGFAAIFINCWFLQSFDLAESKGLAPPLQAKKCRFLKKITGFCFRSACCLFEPMMAGRAIPFIDVSESVCEGHSIELRARRCMDYAIGIDLGGSSVK